MNRSKPILSLDQYDRRRAHHHRQVVAARRQFFLLGLVVALVLGGNVARALAASPRPVPASSITVVKAKRSAPAPALLSTADVEAIASELAGVPVVLSCDTRGVPSPIDGRTMDDDADGEAFYNDAGVIAPVIHMWSDECWSLRISTRAHVPTAELSAYLTFGGRRYDGSSGPALLVLLHEALHVRLQSGDEGHVECLAVENAWSVVRLLHVSSFDSGLLLTGMRWRHSQWLSGSPYRSEC